MQAHHDQFWALFDGHSDKAAQHRRFYDEYLTVMDPPAEFFLETVKKVFQDYALAKGESTWRGRPRCGRRRSGALAAMAVEGEKHGSRIGVTGAWLNRGELAGDDAELPPADGGGALRGVFGETVGGTAVRNG